jgi:hypothetical protein
MTRFEGGSSGVSTTSVTLTYPVGVAVSACVLPGDFFDEEGGVGAVLALAADDVLEVGLEDVVTQYERDDNGKPSAVSASPFRSARSSVGPTTDWSRNPGPGSAS